MKVLAEYTAAVALETVAILDSLEITNIMLLNKYPLRTLALASGLCHALGRLGTKKAYNEISYAITQQNFSLNDRTEDEIVQYCVLWHCPVASGDLPDLEKIIAQPEYAKALSGSLDTFKAALALVEPHYTEESKVLSDSTDRPSRYAGAMTFWPSKDKITNSGSEHDKQALKVLLSNCVIEATRRISSLSKRKTKDYLQNPVFVTPDISRPKPPRYSHLGSLAEKLVKSKSVVITADGNHKDIMPLMITTHHLSSSPSMFVVSPKILQLERLWQAYVREIGWDYEMEAVFHGEKQHKFMNEEESVGFEEESLFVSNINLTTFDRLLSSSFKRDLSREFFMGLKSDLVLHDIHELIHLPGMLIPMKIYLRIRAWCGCSGRTVAVSNTPEPALLRYLDLSSTVLPRGVLPPEHNKRILFKLSSVKPSKFPKGSLVVVNTIDEAQQTYKNLKEDKVLIHSLFTKRLIQEKTRDLLENHCGEDSKEAVLVSVRMLESSLDLNVKRVHAEVGIPSCNAQLIAHQNRLGQKKQDTFNFYVQGEDQDNFGVFAKHLRGHKNTVKLWYTHLKKKLDYPLSMSHDEGMRKLYDEFWENKAALQEGYDYLIDIAAKGLEKLSVWVPREMPKRSSDKVMSLGGIGFRGNSYFLTAKVVNDFGEVGQLTGEDLLTTSSFWDVNLYNIATRQATSKKTRAEKANMVLEEEVFGYTKYNKTFGYTKERPLIFSHVDPDTNRYVSQALKAEGEVKGKKVYHEDLGLINEDFGR